uniref:Uncharacterized protein n=1 Tax=Anguilla anguilla TaxID=7936 RepID=A0A0E9R852_ANGAN
MRTAALVMQNTAVLSSEGHYILALILPVGHTELAYSVCPRDNWDDMEIGVERWSRESTFSVPWQ